MAGYAINDNREVAVKSKKKDYFVVLTEFRFMNLQTMSETSLPGHASLPR
jgi:hypothetical protein